MIKAQVSAIKTMIDGDIRLTVNIAQEQVPDNIITWRFENVVIITESDIPLLRDDPLALVKSIEP